MNMDMKSSKYLMNLDIKNNSYDQIKSIWISKYGNIIKYYKTNPSIFFWYMSFQYYWREGLVLGSILIIW